GLFGGSVIDGNGTSGSAPIRSNRNRRPISSRRNSGKLPRSQCGLGPARFCEASLTTFRPPDLPNDRAQRFDRLWKKFRSRNAAGWAAAKQMWFECAEPFEPATDRIAQHVGNPAVAFTGDPAMLLAGFPILDVKMNDALAGLQPTIPGVVAAKDKIGRIIH